MSVANPIRGVQNLFKKESILSKEDIAALQAYNAEIERNVNPMTAYYRTLTNASDAAVAMAEKAHGATVNIKALEKTSRIATVGVKLLSVALNAALAIGISFAIQGISHMINASKEMSEQAQQATAKFREQSSSI